MIKKGVKESGIMYDSTEEFAWMTEESHERLPRLGLQISMRTPAS
jgi:hypothetical protein